MFRVWLSGFYRRYKEQIAKLLKLFGILILIGIAFAYSVKDRSESGETRDNKTVYNPSKTVISGEDVDKDTYKKEENLVKTFVDYCNNKKIQDAYNLLTDECKEKMYPNIETFKKNYYDIIFTQNRECNLQSWISEKGYNTYKVTFIEDIMETGNYDNVEKLIDYITIVDKDNEQRINVNSYVKTEEINKITKNEYVEITVKSADTYINKVKYYIEATNLSSNVILLDSLKDKSTLKLLATDSSECVLDTLNLFSTNLILYKNTVNKKIELTFKKQYASEKTDKRIEFKKVIIDYEDYIKDTKNYSNNTQMSINLK